MACTILAMLVVGVLSLMTPSRFVNTHIPFEKSLCM